MTANKRPRDAKGRLIAADKMGEKPAMSTGFGDSMIFAAPEGSFDELPERTVNGKPIPAEFRHAVPYENTDQGRAEREAKIEAAGGPARSELLRERITIPGGVNERGEYVPDQYIHVDSDYVGKRTVALADHLKGKAVFEESPDAMREIAAPFMQNGDALRFLNQAQIDRGRGMRGYELVKYPQGHPKSGQVVMCGNMPLGRKSAEDADVARQFYKEKAHSQMVAAQDQVQDGVEHIASLAKVERITGRDREGRASGFERVRGDAADMDDRDFEEAIPGAGR